MRPTWMLAIVTVVLVAQLPVSGAGDRYLGTVAVRTRYQKYLQAHSDNGETHGSNSRVNKEETWLLYVVDEQNGLFALRNFSTEKYLATLETPIRTFGGAVPPSHCPAANQPQRGDGEVVVIRPGPSTVLGRVSIQFKQSGRYLTSKGEGDNDDPCGGEVAAKSTTMSDDPNWNGWWTIENTTDHPSDGNDPFTVFRDIGQGVADVVETLASIFSHIHVY